MTAAQGTVTAPAVAAQGTVSTDATVRGQLAGLQSDVETAVALEILYLYGLEVQQKQLKQLWLIEV